VSWRDRFQSRRLQYGAGSVVSVLLVAGILGLAAGLTGWHSMRWDTTSEQTQSLSPVTKALLK
jgi:uncharacterized protein HemX